MPSGWKFQLKTSSIGNLKLSEVPCASIRQYPLFNERFRRVGVKPTYLYFIDDSGQIAAYVCIITFGFAPIKCGVVRLMALWL